MAGRRKISCFFLIVHGISCLCTFIGNNKKKRDRKSGYSVVCQFNATALAKDLVSEDAIRRDLRALAAEGQVQTGLRGGLRYP